MNFSDVLILIRNNSEKSQDHLNEENLTLEVSTTEYQICLAVWWTKQLDSAVL